nr:MAG TPA_asm: hypothetical protein [Caudoviricetes sp.]
MTSKQRQKERGRVFFKRGYTLCKPRPVLFPHAWK